MKVFRRLPPTEARQPCALPTGHFDGVHLGHQAVLKRLVDNARERALPACVLTFEPHPRKYFAAAPGASTAAQIWYGYWPQIRPAFWSIVLLRWDINVRESAVLGLVGAGGIGMAMQAAIDLFQWERVAMILVSIFVIVIVAEIAVTALRKRIL